MAKKYNAKINSSILHLLSKFIFHHSKNFTDRSKPYGFCCSIEDKKQTQNLTLKNLSFENVPPVNIAAASGAALKFQLQYTEPRREQEPKTPPSINPSIGQASKTTLLDFEDEDDDELEMIPDGLSSDEERRLRRQLEYERNMDRWARIGELKSNSHESEEKLEESCSTINLEQIRSLKKILGLSFL